MGTRIRDTESIFRNMVKAGEMMSQTALYITETDEAKIVAKLKFLELVFTDQALMLCPMSHPTPLRYVSSVIAVVLGYTSKQIDAMSVPDFFDRVHPDDLENVKRCFEFINASEPYDPELHRFVLHYRFRHAAGHYIHLRDEKLAVRDEGGKYIYFTLFKDISVEQGFSQVRMSLLQRSKLSFTEVYTFFPRAYRNEITPRQNDILQLIVRGLSNKEIADRLNVSIYTIKNHKQALFKKVNVKNSLELASLAGQRSTL
jgi:DNA-binding CsgD family transcriptional regulator